MDLKEIGCAISCDGLIVRDIIFECTVRGTYAALTN